MLTLLPFYSTLCTEVAFCQPLLYKYMIYDDDSMTIAFELYDYETQFGTQRLGNHHEIALMELTVY